MEPVLQALSRAGLLESLRGPRGGYRLARRPREIRLWEVVAGGEEAEAGGGGQGAAGRLQAAVVAALGRNWRRGCASGSRR